MARQIPLINTMIRTASAGFLLLLIQSCTPKISGTNISNFPPPKGFYGGSLIYAPWVYHGSTKHGHYLFYTRHDNNIPDRTQVIFSITEISIDHPFPLTSVPDQWRKVRPVIDDQQRIVSFEILSKSH